MRMPEPNLFYLINFFFQFTKSVYLFFTSALDFLFSMGHLPPIFIHYHFHTGAVFSQYEHGCFFHTLCNNAMFATTDYEIVSQT